MPAWISAWVHYEPLTASGVRRAENGEQRLPSVELRTEVATVLVDMVLSVQRG